MSHTAPHARQAHVLAWDQLPTDTPMPLIDRQRIIGDKAMISRVTLKPGCFVPTHAHENEQFAIVLSGRAVFGLGAEGSSDRKEVEAVGGQVVLLPSGVPHSCRAIDETVILDVFSPPSAGTGIDRR